MTRLRRGALPSRPAARAPGGGPTTLAAAVLAAAAFCSGCAPAGEDPPELRELEGLAFLPAGSLTLSVVNTRASAEQRSLGTGRPLLVDVYEATRGAWRRFLADSSDPVDPLLEEQVRDWPPETSTWPAAYMTQPEAAAFAAWRGMRLLTAGEWIYCAMGPTGWPYPWGTTWQESVANTLELQLERPTPVGTFESGRSPIGCYDLLGNVAEWVADAPPGTDLLPGDGRVAAMGGSFRQHTYTIDRPLYEPRERRFLASYLPPGSRADHVGVRCGAPAAEYLWQHAPQWGDGEAVRKRLVAVGRRWGRRALPLLQELAARPGAPGGLSALAEGARE